MKQLPLNVIYYGSDQSLPERRPLRAGPLSLVFEAGDLRYVCWGKREVLRRVYMAVLDVDKSEVHCGNRRGGERDVLRSKRWRFAG